MIKIKVANKKGYIECCNGGVFDGSYVSSKTRRGRVQGGGVICPTIPATVMELYVIWEISNDN